MNVFTGSKHCWSQHGSTIFLFFHEFQIIHLQNVCLSHIWNLQTVCYTLTPDDKYSRRNIQTFWQQLQTFLSQEEKIFCRLFIAFTKCAWNLENSEKKEEYHNLIITEIIATERDVYISV